MNATETASSLKGGRIELVGGLRANTLRDAQMPALIAIVVIVFVIIIAIQLIAFLIPIVVALVAALLIGLPGALAGMFASWLLCQRKARIAAEQLLKSNPIGAIVRFAYAHGRPAIVWELDETKLSSYTAGQEFELLRWAAALLSSAFVLLVTLFLISLKDFTWEGLMEWSYVGGAFFDWKLGIAKISVSPFNMSNWSYLEWTAILVSFAGIIYFLAALLPEQRRDYSRTVKQTAANLIERETPMLRELSGLYTQAWEATELAAERIGRTGSVTLLASIENNWDALKSENLLSILQADGWTKFRSVCEGMRTDAIKLEEYALKYLRGEAIPEEEQPEMADSEAESAFALLGIPSGSNPDVIKRIFRKLAKIYHPDSGDVPSDEHFKKINDAYDFLRRELNF